MDVLTSRQNLWSAIVRDLGVCDYADTLARMRRFTLQRDPDTADELWLLQHPPVFTQGQAGKPEHVLDAGDIPVVQADRGGQVTYHGPGQVVIYVLVDLRRLHVGIRSLVTCVEKAMIAEAAAHGVQAFARREAPGVYVQRACDDGNSELCKLGSLGLRVRHGCSYHGLAFNVAMDLTPFERINPCGYKGLKMAQLVDLKPAGHVLPDTSSVARELADAMLRELASASGERNPHPLS